MIIENVEKGYAAIAKTRPEEESINLSPESTFIVSGSDMVNILLSLRQITDVSKEFYGVLFTNTETANRDAYLLLKRESDLECVAVNLNT